MSNTCLHCGKNNLFEAKFCQTCGSKLECLPLTGKLYGKTNLLTIYGAFVCLLGGLLGLGSSISYGQRYYFGEMCSTLFLVSLFSIVSFAFLAFGLISTSIKNRQLKR